MEKFGDAAQLLQPGAPQSPFLPMLSMPLAILRMVKVPGELQVANMEGDLRHHIIW